MTPFVWPAPCSRLPATLYWTEEDWDRWWVKFRPKDYYGGECDQEAWKSYASVRFRIARADFQRRHGMGEDLVLEVNGISPRLEGPSLPGKHLLLVGK